MGNEQKLNKHILTIKNMKLPITIDMYMTINRDSFEATRKLGNLRQIIREGLTNGGERV